MHGCPILDEQCFETDLIRSLCDTTIGTRSSWFSLQCTSQRFPAARSGRCVVFCFLVTHCEQSVEGSAEASDSCRPPPQASPPGDPGTCTAHLLGRISSTPAPVVAHHQAKGHGFGHVFAGWGSSADFRSSLVTPLWPSYSSVNIGTCLPRPRGAWAGLSYCSQHAVNRPYAA